MKTLSAACIVLLCLSAGCARDHAGSGVRERQRMGGNLEADMDLLLPAGRVTVDRMDGVKRDTRLSELNKKFRKGAREHYDWYVDYIQSYPVGPPPPYHPNFGMTEEEFNEMNARIAKIEFYSTGLQEIDIIHEAGKIRFRADKKLKVLESVRIDPATRTAAIGNRVLHLADTVTVNLPNGFKSRWKGYVWMFEEPENMHLDALRNITRLHVIQYKLTVGQLEDGRTLLAVRCIEVEDGIVMLEVDVPVIF